MKILVDFARSFRGMTALIAALIIRHSIDLMWGAITVVVTVDLVTPRANIRLSVVLDRSRVPMKGTPTDNL
jgi:hypothetical protein